VQIPRNVTRMMVACASCNSEFAFTRLVTDSELDPQLRSVVIAAELMLEEVQTEGPSLKKMAKPKEDMACVIKIDNVFYRAVIIAIEGQKANVYLVDNGKLFKISLRK